jgi:phospholipase/carboxylesterase
MDHIEQSIKPHRGPSGDQRLNIESPLFSTSSHNTTCALFAPLHYEAGYAYPLLVWLHGRGPDEGQLMRIMPQVSIRNYVAVAPRGICLSGGGGAEEERYGWQQSEDHIQRAEQRIFDSIETSQRRFHIARQRVFLAGFDCGGTMAFRVAMTHPTRFAGVLSLCGAFPSGSAPFGNLLQARRLPVFLAVGRDSREYPSAEVCQHLRLFHAAGLSITLRQYPCGHVLWPQMLADVTRWIMDQFFPAEASAAPADRHWSRETD